MPATAAAVAAAAAAAAAEADATAASAAAYADADADAPAVVALFIAFGARGETGRGPRVGAFFWVGGRAGFPDALGTVYGVGVDPVKTHTWLGVTGAGGAARGGL